MLSLSDEELLERSVKDGEAFGVFYDRQHLVLLAALRQRVGSTEAALDLTAEIFATALVRVAHFVDRGPGSARAWLFGIARFMLVDHYRAGAAETRARMRLGIPVLDLDEVELAMVTERIDAEMSGVTDALAALPEDERAAVQARVVDEDAYPEIADRFSVTEAAIRQRVSRGLSRLRTTIKEQSR